MADPLADLTKRIEQRRDAERSRLAECYKLPYDMKGQLIRSAAINAYDNALAEVAAVRGAERRWQSINSAPKDGTTIQLYGEGKVTVGGWVSASDQGAEPGEEHLISAGWWSLDLRDNDPTHWQPLADPPSLTPPSDQEK